MDQIRYAIYVYWDKQGELREFANYYIDELRKSCTRVLVIVNGKFNQIARDKLKKKGVEIFQRDNVGYDFFGYKNGIEILGEDLEKCDELIICNSSTYGPLYSLSDVFNRMAKSDCDFWGITAHANTKLIPSHIQSYFVVFRKKCFLSKPFKKFWQELPMPINREEAIRLGEIQLTQFLSSQGFSWETLVPLSLHEKISPDVSLRNADYALQLGSPFVKRKLFTTERYHFLACSYAGEPSASLEFIQKNTKYKESLIFDDLISSFPYSAWNGLIRNNFVLSAEKYPKINAPSLSKTAAIIFVYFEDLVEEVTSYLLRLPEEMSIFIVSPKTDLLNRYTEKLKSKFKNLQCREHPNRGRNESAFFIICRDVLEKFDYVCLLHDKKCSHLEYEIYGRTFQKHCFESLICNAAYVQRIIETFEANTHLGLLVPPWPVFGPWDGPRSCNFGINEKKVNELYKSLNLTVPLDPNTLFPVGTMFWARKNALKSFFKKNWMLTDFPEEPLKTDGTILHALERMYCLFSQDSGYYFGWVLPDNYASVYIDNLLFRNYPPEQNYNPQFITSERIVTYAQFKLDARLFIRRKIREYFHRISLLTYKLFKY